MIFLVNATRHCYPNGSWAATTNYHDCMCNSTEDCTVTSTQEENGALEISIIIYLVGKRSVFSYQMKTDPSPGYVLSFLALCGALAIFLSFRSSSYPAQSWLVMCVLVGRCGACGTRYILDCSVLLDCRL